MKPVNRSCPLCGKPLVRQSILDAGGYEPDIYCPEEIILEEDKRTVNHYREFPITDHVVIHIPPYRIFNTKSGSKVGKRARYKTKRGVKTSKGAFYFKTIINCPEIHPDTEEKLRERIKLLLVLS